MNADKLQKLREMVEGRKPRYRVELGRGDPFRCSERETAMSLAAKFATLFHVVEVYDRSTLIARYSQGILIARRLENP